MSNNETTVKSKEEQAKYLEPKQPSLMTQLAKSLREKGINAQVIRKINFQ